MGLFDKTKPGGFMDEIRCDESSYLIWKWHPKGANPGDNSRENAIRWGSSIRVKYGEAAVFLYHWKSGRFQDYVEGPYDGILRTENLPVLSSLIGLAYDGGTPFQAEIYYINLAQLIQVRFGVPFFDVYDPRLSNFGVPIAVRGTISFKIQNVKTFVELHRMQNFSLEDFEKQIRDAVTRYVKDAVANAPAVHGIPVVQIESKTAQINDLIEYDLVTRLQEQFGVVVSGVDIGAIEIDKSSEGYRNIMEVTQNIEKATVQAETAVNIKQMQDKQRIEAENYQETLRMQREEAQYARHKQTQTANFAAYQTEAQTEVGVAGAEGLGKMGEGGGVSGGGFNPAAMMAGMTIGSAFGQNIAGAIHQTIPGSVPPPIPTVAYHVALNQQAAGPFDLATLKQMAGGGTLTKETLVWKKGMDNWKNAGEVGELQSLFEDIPPVIPT